MQVRTNPKGKIGTCGCGRSPTGDCIGWHGMTTEQFQRAQENWLEEQMKKDQEALDSKQEK